MSAFTFPFGPIVRLPPIKSNFPSRFPSMNKSSFPVTSPLIFIPWLMHAVAREETGAFAAAFELEFPAGAAPAGVVEISVTPCGFASSFFHTRHLDSNFWFFEVAFESAGGDATRKRQDIIGVKGCKGEYGPPNLACYVIGYTTYWACLAHGSTICCDVSCLSSFPRSSHIATAIPATSLTNSFTDFLLSYQCAGSKSPSLAPATLTEIFPGNTLLKIYRALRV